MNNVTELRPREPIQPGDKIRTEGWSSYSDIASFTVLELLDDDPEMWVRCVDDAKGYKRCFLLSHCRKLERSHA